SVSENFFDGEVDSKNFNSFYLLGRQYGYLLFKQTNKLKLTGRKIKIYEIVYQGKERDGFLNSNVIISLLNGDKHLFPLGILGFSESSQFDRIFSVMNDDDKAKVEEFVGIKTHHYKTSFLHDDYNIKYQIINGSLIFFKTYDNRMKIELDSIMEVQWTK
ncbi:MAG: hypothetical protein O9262_06295, partial [Cyclobacteriaceae bacterium]|nr:hypothetical protein [Cyclobacteriaceae bacterium]